MADNHQQQKKQSARDAILVLASLLSESGVPKFSAECFRLAKFNKCEAARDMWLLMYHIMQLLTYLEEAKDDFSLEHIDSGQFLKPSDAKLPVVSLTVREYLFTLGYTRPCFFSLHRGVSSREILLACGWLICEQKLIPKLTKYFLNASRKIEIPFKNVHQSILERLISENDIMQSEMKSIVSTISEKASINNLGGSMETLHKLAWLKNSIEYKWKELHRAQMAFQKVAHEIYQCTRSSNRLGSSKQKPTGLCVDEVFLLCYPNYMKLHLRKLSKCANVLELVVQWLSYEPLFWQWMESVMDLQEEAELTGRVDKNDEMLASSQDSEVERKKAAECTKPQGKDKDDLVAQWSVLQDEMKGLLERNQLYMGKTYKVLEHKSRMVEQSLFNRQQQDLLKKIRLECPCVSPPVESTRPVVHSMLGGLAPIDRPHFVPEGSCVGRPSQASGQHHKATNIEDNVGARAEKNMMVANLQALEVDLDSCKSSMSAILSALEDQLPPTLYKLNQVTNLRYCGGLS